MTKASPTLCHDTRLGEDAFPHTGSEVRRVHNRQRLVAFLCTRRAWYSDCAFSQGVPYGSLQRKVPMQPELD